MSSVKTTSKMIIALALLQLAGCGKMNLVEVNRRAATGSGFDAESKDFLDRVRLSFRQSLPDFQKGLEPVSRVEDFAVQRNFGEAISRARLSQEKASQLIQLQQYFVVMKALEAALSSHDLSSFDLLADGVIEESSGDWTEAFKKFCTSERLELPSAALFQALRHSADSNSTNDGATVMRNLIVDGEVENFFQQQSQQAKELGLAVSRSMRHVKAVIRLGLSSQQRSVPFFLRALYSKAPSAPKSPDFSAAGFDIKIAGWSAWYFLQYNYNRGAYDCAFRPVTETIKLILNDYDPENIYYIDDYHHLCPELSDPGAIAEILSAIREVRPGAVVGFYGFVPAVDYWTLLKPDNDPTVVNYKSINDERMRILGEHVDLIMPSTYFVYGATLSANDAEIQMHAPPSNPVDPVNPDRGLLRWKQTRSRSIAEAHRLAGASFRQPVVPFLWPQYYDGHGFQNVYVSGALYKMAVEHLLDSGIDGLVHWDAVSTGTLWDPTFADPEDGRISWYEAILP